MENDAYRRRRRRDRFGWLPQTDRREGWNRSRRHGRRQPRWRNHQRADRRHPTKDEGRRSRNRDSCLSDIFDSRPAVGCRDSGPAPSFWNVRQNHPRTVEASPLTMRYYPPGESCLPVPARSSTLVPFWSIRCPTVAFITTCSSVAPIDDPRAPGAASCWAPVATVSDLSTTILKSESAVAIAPTAARPGAPMMPTVATVSGISMNVAPLWSLMMIRRTLPSWINSLTFATSWFAWTLISSYIRPRLSIVVSVTLLRRHADGPIQSDYRPI